MDSRKKRCGDEITGQKWPRRLGQCQRHGVGWKSAERVSGISPYSFFAGLCCPVTEWTSKDQN